MDSSLQEGSSRFGNQELLNRSVGNMYQYPPLQPLPVATVPGAVATVKVTAKVMAWISSGGSSGGSVLCG